MESLHNWHEFTFGILSAKVSSVLSVYYFRLFMTYYYSAPAKLYPPSPPSYLAASVHSLLLSTLLQPSAVFLAIWYIVRLPVYFDAVGLSPDHVKETHFRTELLGDSHIGLDREVLEASAPFRLILLGCMLANKWLDDHTFSNKTWSVAHDCFVLSSH